jgi:hypothetical protein
MHSGKAARLRAAATKATEQNGAALKAAALH